MKLCTGVFDITMMVTTLKAVFDIMFPGVHFRISSSISRELLKILSWGVLGAFSGILFKGAI